MPALDVRRRARGPFPGAVMALRSAVARGHGPEELRLQVAGTSIGREVEVEVGPIDEHADRLRVPVVVRPARNPAVFPVFKGVLSLRARSGSEFELELTGSYRPPLGALGRVGDAVAGQRMAARTMEGFVDTLTRRLAEAAVHWGEDRYWRTAMLADPDLHPNRRGSSGPIAPRDRAVRP